MYIKNFEHNRIVKLEDQIQFEKGRIVSKALVQRNDMTLTLFAFDQKEGLSTHASSGDAMVNVLKGQAEVVIDGVKHEIGEGQTIVMPANIPHAVTAITPYKMLLTVIKPEIDQDVC